MKYFTKEWYKMCQNSEWYLSMSVSKNAEEFNEEYYRDLYIRRRRAFVKDQKEMAEVLGEEFSKAKAEMEFMKSHEETVKQLEENLPQTILAEVADTRVLALDITTKEVRQKLKAWSESNLKEVQRVQKEYWEEVYPAQKEAVGEEIQKNFHFHDAAIRSMEMKGKELSFRLDASDVKKVIFKNYKILEQNGYLLGATWLYEEVYAVEGGNEYHVLLWKKGGKTACLTVFAEEIEFVK